MSGMIASPYDEQLARIPVSAHRTDVDGTETAWWEYGSADAPMLVLVHGFRGDHHGLEPVVVAAEAVHEHEHRGIRRAVLPPRGVGAVDVDAVLADGDASELLVVRGGDHPAHSTARGLGERPASTALATHAARSPGSVGGRP